ncbi:MULTISPECIES: helix-turn-helix transcriptional regulator [unclassified Pseudomonas]|uniref:helix-turn-helix transcriptional regulator n=1 Tax=unclassified Pseudomonas TaxID=196821 RepID=UPI00131DAEF3|nr:MULTISPECIES: helix-turn-helix transcriptional regulator [unclassified Pseudomonas]
MDQSAVVSCSVPSAVVARFSQVVLALQARLRGGAITEFHAQALEQLQCLVAFDKAWWGNSAWRDGAPVAHSTFLLGLPRSYTREWDALKADDRALGDLHQEQGRCQLFDCRDQTAAPALAALGQRYGLAHGLRIVLTDDQTRLGVHLTLFREDPATPFTALECQLVEWLMPHLLHAERESCLRTLATLRDSQGSFDETALAVCDRYGVLLSMEPGFAALLAGEWEGWQGNRLPPACDPQGTYQGRTLQLDAQALGDLLLLKARRRSSAERLSARELEVAQCFALGQTYKEVARNLGMAPATVRHHLRRIYEKLGVNRKAQIAQRVAAAPD